jgi:hypothetical protein
MKVHVWSAEEKEYLKGITPGRCYKEIQELMNKKFALEFTINQIKGAIGRYKLNTGRTGRFEKGNVPFNKGIKGSCAAGCEKTWFEKGNKPKNYMPIGSQRVNGDGYVDIKIADPNKWKGKHILIWENHNGPVPKGHAVIFGDGNPRNFNPDNLIMVSRKQLLVMNRNNLIQNDADLTRTGVIIADLHLRISKRKKG